MVRFSCFPTHIHYHRSKKVVQQYSDEKHAGEMHINSPEFSQDGAVKASPGSTSSNIKMEDNNISNATAEQITSPSSFECCGKSENATSFPEDDNDVVQSMLLKKSQSLGSGLDREGGFSFDVDTEDEFDRRLSLNNSHYMNHGGLLDSFDNCRHDGPEMNLLDQNQEDAVVESFEINNDRAAHESIFSIGDLKEFDKEPYEDIGEQLSSDHVVESGHFIVNTLPIFAKSHSFPSLRVSSFKPNEGSPAHKLMVPRSRSTSDIIEKRLHHQADLGECIPADKSGGFKEMTDQDKDLLTGIENHKYDKQLSDGYDSHNLGVLTNDWREQEMDGRNTVNSQPESSLVKRWDEMDRKEFNIKRIEEWIRQIDILDSSPMQELGESSSSPRKMKMESHLTGVVNSAKPDARDSPGVEAAYNYISTMTATSTSAQMANLGLVAIPFLSAFSSLRALNLSCNSIVRITAGALPRGLHMLNLSKNNISTIEGLRELTRLRVLDLGYNRIFKIGHGLASCSSLKELYLAGNKISEVEGLHRLLKLNVLDLRFNKISMAKCLGQLAANYGSLQSINLEGNPAQRNVGDEQLKRYLLGLLPHLVYFNRHIIRTSSSKEISERSMRSSTSHQFDRGTRSEQKRSRRVHHSAAPPKLATSSNHGRGVGGQAVSSTTLKTSRDRDRHGRLPPTGSKVAHHLPSIGSKLLSFQPINPIRRSRSEGNL